MKIVVLVLICLSAGIGLGLLSTQREFAEERLPTEGLLTATSANAQSSTFAQGQKLVIVGGAAYNFGEMDRHAEGEHEFVFRNEGKAPIGLRKGQTTCKCTMSEMKDGELQPGESMPIKLTWNAKTGETEFSQSAEIITTNYPAQPVIRLHVYGKIIDALRIDRGNLSLGSISSSENATAHFKVLAFRGEEPLEIVKHEFTEADRADHFSVSFRPLTPKEVAAESGAKSGVEATLHIKSGLPLGNIGQSIRLTTNLPNTSAMTVPIEGRIVGDIMLVGPGAASDQNMIRLGDTTSAQGKTARYHLVVKGPHRSETTLKITAVEPADSLQAMLGEALTDNPQVTRYPLNITIPKGAKPISRQGLTPGEAGVIRLSTTHPQIKEFVIIVRYAVTE
jgi:hypothetical protein